MSPPTISPIVLFVDNPEISANFYKEILQQEPVEQSETFVLFALPNNLLFGLWSKHTAKPEVKGTSGSCEICFTESDVLKVYEKWKSLNVPILLEPCSMDGLPLTFVALDPDKHRLRVLCME